MKGKDMPKLTINEKEYYTDDFNEDQLKLYQEIQIASAEMSRLEYNFKVLENRVNFLAGSIEHAANEAAVELEETSSTDAS